jgi:hypothetical protein
MIKLVMGISGFDKLRFKESISHGLSGLFNSILVCDNSNFYLIKKLI